MSTPKKSFGDFVKRPAITATEPAFDNGDKDQSVEQRLMTPTGTRDTDDRNPTLRVGDERIREVTSTGRVRTHSATRQLPGITLRVNEERWEKLKMMSMQERRPLQEILGEALERYMKERGLPW